MARRPARSAPPPSPLGRPLFAPPPQPEPMRFTPKTRLSPVGMAIQRALMRTDAGDRRTRLERLGERLVRDALAGDKEATKIVLDRFEGKVTTLTEEGAESESLQQVLLAQLVEGLVERKLGKPITVARDKPVIDVVEVPPSKE